MVTICRSCNHEVWDNYCSHCGQKKAVRRITWSIFMEELSHLFTHIEKGFLRTTWQMLRNPGRLMKSYLDGQRKNIQHPISYLAVWAGVFYLVKVVINTVYHYKLPEGNNIINIDFKATDFYAAYPTALTILFTPVWAIIAWLTSYRKKLNYLEVLITCFYGYGQFFAYLSICWFIWGLVLHISIWSTFFSYLILTVTTIDAFWKNYSLLRVYKFNHLILRLFVTQIVGIISFIEFIEFSFYIVKKFQNH